MVTVSETAAIKLNSLIEESGFKTPFVRVAVKGGGCSGFSYGFTFDDVINEDDFEIPLDEFKVLVDAMSMQYLSGAEIDYKEDLQGSAFNIKNPNATTTCGCGSSFGV